MKPPLDALRGSPAADASPPTRPPAGPPGASVLRSAFRIPHSVPLAHPLRDLQITRVADRHTFHAEAVQAGYERGRLDGERALAAQLLQQRAEIMELQTGLLAALRNTLPQIIRDSERTLVALALEVAQKLVAGLPISGELVQATVQEALTQVADGTAYTVQLHPDDFALLERMNSPLLLPQDGQEKVRFHATAQIPRGGCVVQTRFGLIDGRRATKAEVLGQALAS